MKRKRLMCLAVTLLMCIGTPLWAWHGEDDMTMDGPRQGKGYGPLGMIKELNLTPEQQAKVDAIMDQHRKEIRLIHEKIDADRNALHESIHNEVFDEQTIRKTSRALAADKEEMDVLRGRMSSEIRMTLSPEQTAKLKEMKKMRQEQRECREKCRNTAEE